MTDESAPGPPDGREAPCRALFEHSPDAILLVDDEGTIVDANPRATAHLGYDRDALVGRRCWSFTSGDPDAARARWTAVEAGDTTSFEDCHERADGSTIPVRVQVRRVDLDDGIAFIGIVRDVSEQREREAALEAQARRLETFELAFPDLAFVIDAEGRYLDVIAGPGQEELLYTDPETFLGRTADEVLPADDAERQQEIVRAAIETGEPQTHQYVLAVPAGVRRFEAHVQALPFEVDGTPAAVWVARDVTVRAHREQTLAALHESTRRLLEADSVQAVAEVTSNAVQHVLRHPFNTVRLHRDGLLVPVAVSDERDLGTGRERPTYRVGQEPVGLAYERGETLRYDDVTTIEDDVDRGRSRAAIYVPLGDDGVLSIADDEPGTLDESDVRLAEILADNVEAVLASLEQRAELDRHRARLERQNERLEEFASVVSHDLRNPLNVALGRVELAYEDDDEAHLDAIEAALDRMGRIIDDVLWLAREGRDIGETAAVDLGAAVEDAWEMVVDEAGAADLVLQADDGGLGAVRADPDRLGQLLENLLANAIEHGGDGVEVAVGRLDDGFYVEDDGPGVPEADRARVFEAGFSSESSGTGFGLAIVRQVAEAHGWDVRLVEGSRGGARFEFTGVERPGG